MQTVGDEKHLPILKLNVDPIVFPRHETRVMASISTERILSAGFTKAKATSTIRTATITLICLYVFLAVSLFSISPIEDIYWGQQFFKFVIIFTDPFCILPRSACEVVF